MDHQEENARYQVPADALRDCVVCEYEINYAHDATKRLRVGDIKTRHSKTPLHEFLIQHLGDDEDISADSKICDKCVAFVNRHDLRLLRECGKKLPPNSKAVKGQKRPPNDAVKRRTNQQNATKVPPKVKCLKKDVSLTKTEVIHSVIPSSNEVEKLLPTISASFKAETRDISEISDESLLNVYSSTLMNTSSIKLADPDDSSFVDSVIETCISPDQDDIQNQILPELDIKPALCDPNLVPSVVIKPELLDENLENEPVHIISADMESNSIHSINDDMIVHNSSINDPSDDLHESGKTYESNSTLGRLAMYSINEHLTCTLCSHAAPTNYEYEWHMLDKHNVTLKFPCLHCDDKFLQKSALDSHVILTHPNQKTNAVVLDKDSLAVSLHHSCPKCAKVCHSARALVFHVNNAHGAQKYFCKYCPFKCNSSITLKRHDAEMHKKESIMIYDCQMCNTVFDSLEDLENHSIETHNLKKTNRCNLCGETFATEIMMKAHIKRHKPFNCTSCSHGFKKRENLLTHMETVHKNDDPIENDDEYVIATSVDDFCEDSNTQAAKTLFITSNGIAEQDMQSTSEGDPVVQGDSSLVQEYDKVLADELLKKTVGRAYSDKIVCIFCLKEVTCSHLRAHFKIHSGDDLLDCPHCDKQCIQSTNLRKHIRNRHPEHYVNPKKPKKKTVECEYCQITCANFDDLEQHLWEHMQEKIFQCNECHMKFGMKASFNDHMKIHYFKERKECDICKRQFKSMGYYDEHVEKCRNQWKCDQCGTLCIHEAGYRRHMKYTHPTADLTKYECAEEGCGKMFYDKHRFDDHQITHNTEKRFECDVCNKKFKRLRPMRDHRASKHASVKCNDCGYTFANNSLLTEHRISSHIITNCPICDLFFVDDNTLKNHILSVHPENSMFKVILCDFCNNVFDSEAALKKHSLTHSDEIYQICSISECYTTFTDDESCRNHMVEEHEEFIFNCALCQQEFDSELSLVEHIRETHKPCLECSQCGQMFYSQFSLDQHQLLHSNDQKYSCADCHFHSPNRYWFITHLKKKHAASIESNSIINRTVQVQVFACTACDATSETEEEMTEHIEQHRSQVGINVGRELKVIEKKLFEDEHINSCPICGVELLDVDAVNQHFEESAECAARLRAPDEDGGVNNNEAAGDQQVYIIQSDADGNKNILVSGGIPLASSSVDDSSQAVYQLIDDQSSSAMHLAASANQSSPTFQLTTDQASPGFQLTNDDSSSTFQLATNADGQLVLYRSEGGDEMDPTAQLVGNCDESSLQALLSTALLNNDGQIVLPNDTE